MTPDSSRKSVTSRLPGSWNHYAYALEDPIKYKDPRGRDGCDPDEKSCVDDEDCPAGYYWNDEEESCVQEPSEPGGGGGGSQQPTCDIELQTHGAGSPFDPAQHTKLVLTESGVGDENATLTWYIEAGSFVNNQMVGPAGVLSNPGNVFLNKNPNSGTPLYGPGANLWDFANEYDNATLCGAINDILRAFGAYQDDTIHYSLSGPNSNSFTNAMIGAGGLELPSWLNGLMSLPPPFGLFPGWTTPL